jgi:hypothetical protein
MGTPASRRQSTEGFGVSRRRVRRSYARSGRARDGGPDEGNAKDLDGVDVSSRSVFTGCADA